jgi:hypothetical protein
MYEPTFTRPATFATYAGNDGKVELEIIFRAMHVDINEQSRNQISLTAMPVQSEGYEQFRLRYAEIRRITRTHIPQYSTFSEQQARDSQLPAPRLLNALKMATLSLP